SLSTSIPPTPPTKPTTKSFLTTNNLKNLITISTLNVQGLNDKGKHWELTKTLTSERHIFCCSETK
ncbi:1222_t:CDS:1, partial [Acaulospora morrowiae]